jgi:hypothetical protein
MLVALNEDSIPGDFLPLLKIEGRFRFDSRRCGLLPSCIFYTQGAPLVCKKVGRAALTRERKILEDLIAEIDPHDVYPGLPEKATKSTESW